jgi:hypothetical protein
MFAVVSAISIFHDTEVQGNPPKRFLYLKSRNFLNGVYVNFKQGIKVHCTFQMPMEPPI